MRRGGWSESRTVSKRRFPSYCLMLGCIGVRVDRVSGDPVEAYFPYNIRVVRRRTYKGASPIAMSVWLAHSVRDNQDLIVFYTGLKVFRYIYEVVACCRSYPVNFLKMMAK